MMRALLVAFWLLAAGAVPALAQGCGQSNPNCIVPTAPNGTSNNQAASTRFVASAMAGIYTALSGDCTATNLGVITCTKTGGAAFAPSATTNALNASNISSGTLPAARLPSTPIANALSADVALNNTANYFDGPSVAQGTSGTWLATGQVTVQDTGTSAQIFCKLWDGTTVIASGNANVVSGGFEVVALSGFLANPAANLKISCRNAGDTTGVIKFNATGNSKDSTISGVRIN